LKYKYLYPNYPNLSNRVNSLIKASNINYYNKYYYLNTINIKRKAIITTYKPIFTNPRIKINTYYIIIIITIVLNNNKYKFTINTSSYLIR